jgi:hypothetical protein
MVVYHNTDFLYNSFIEKGIVYFIIWFLTVVVNSFEVFTHLVVFMDNVNIINYKISGSKENQSHLTFALWNILDISGFVLLMILFDGGNLWISFLTFMHIGSGLSGIFFPCTFQDYYIDKHPVNTDDWRKTMMRFARSSFTILDAVTRFGYIWLLII